MLREKVVMLKKRALPEYLPISCSQARYGAALDFNQTADNTFKLFHDRGDKVRYATAA